MHDHHDHAHHHHAPQSLEAVLADAEADCAKRGLRLTPQRRDALAALAEAKKPLGAYDILSIMVENGRRKLAPIAVYRALDFLLEAGLIHRLESRNAFILCPHHHGKGDTVVFLICEGCGRVEEATSDAVSHDLADIARRHGFELKGQVIEMDGRCTACLSQPAFA
jgi:Fur family transcriptional regulator, zinc uptake regulator